ncbi:AzlD domain-containing protein [uncultured Rothia sp.]|uniref:branched-chain amino acid transporter permease n=1 Tax=uncultured Rothia sp. TaxID=316088 RepID=UPI003217A126
MPSIAYILSAIGIAAGITFILRLIPFGIKSILKDNKLIADLAAWIPMGAILILGVYVMAEIDYSSTTTLPYLIAAVVTVVVHSWRKNIALSLLIGTATCVVLANWVF